MLALSKGQRKLLELELILAGTAPVLVMDEPFEGLDPVVRAEVQERILNRLSDGQTCLLLSSHVLTDLERLCDHVGVLAGGKIRFEGNLDEIRSSVMLVSGPLSRESALEGWEVLERRVASDQGVWLVRGTGGRQPLDLQRDGFQVTVPSLDELGTELLRSRGPLRVA